MALFTTYVVGNAKPRLILWAITLSLLLHGLVMRWSKLSVLAPTQFVPRITEVRLISPVLQKSVATATPRLPRTHTQTTTRTVQALPAMPAESLGEPLVSSTSTPSAEELPDPSELESPSARVADEIERPLRGPLAETLPLPQSIKIEYDVSGISRRHWNLGVNSNGELLWQHNWQDFSVTLRETIWGFMYRARGALSEAGLEPVRWEDRVGNRKNLRGVTYARERGEILFSASNKAVSLPVGVQNIPSVFLQLGVLLKQNPAFRETGTAMKIAVTTAKDLVEHTVQNKGKETIETPFGPVETLAFTTLTGQKEYEEGIVLWLSPAHQYLPLKFKVSTEDGLVLTGVARLLTSLPPLLSNQEWAE